MKKLILACLILAITNIAYSKCEFKPEYIIQIEENTTCVVNYDIQVMRLGIKHPQQVKLHEGLKAIPDYCNDHWVITTTDTYKSYNSANESLRSWINKGYKDSFIRTIFVYYSKGNASDNVSYNKIGDDKKDHTVYYDKIESNNDKCFNLYNSDDVIINENIEDTISNPVSNVKRFNDDRKKSNNVEKGKLKTISELNKEEKRIDNSEDSATTQNDNSFFKWGYIKTYSDYSV
jgi:hypothetical protein